MEITTTARHPFEKCTLDIVGPMTDTVSGNKYILTFQDDLSKFIVAIPIPQEDAETVAKKFVLNFVLKFSAPAQILTDQGQNFLSDLLKNMCKLLKIKKIQTTAFHPESNVGLDVVIEYWLSTYGSMYGKTKPTEKCGFRTRSVYITPRYIRQLRTHPSS